MNPLASVATFGGIDADTDDLLDQCFENHSAFRDAVGGRRFLIVGRKGSGKTAIYRSILKENAHNIFTFGHTFRDYPWHHHDKQIRTGVPEQECYVHSWKYLILIGLAKILVNSDQSQPWSDAAADHLSKIEGFIIDTYGVRNPEINQIFQPGTMLKLNASFGAKLGPFSAQISPNSIPVDSLPSIAPEVNRAISDKIIESLNPENKYYVLFDELDLGFSPKDENYALRLIGLILAARDLNVLARESKRTLNVVIFIRDDIYGWLNFEDKNKLTEAAISRIGWDVPGSPTLKHLMERRIKNVLDVEAEDAWSLAFDETKEMRGHQTKYQHILDRTMLRPRDMIKFSNAVLEQYKRDNAKGEKFSNENISSARKGYSDYLFRELTDEIFKHVPDYRSFFDLLRELEALQFDLDEFKKACETRSDLASDKFGPAEILAELFEFSIVGFYQPGGGGYGGAEYIYRYKSPDARFNPKANSYQVHMGLQETLGLKRYRRNTREAAENDEE